VSIQPFDQSLLTVGLVLFVVSIFTKLSISFFFQQSSQTAANQSGQGSNITAGLAGGLTVLLGGIFS
jgi:hypothetical protein